MELTEEIKQFGHNVIDLLQQCSEDEALMEVSF